MTDYEEKSLKKFVEAAMKGKFPNASLVQFIELAGTFLNIQSIPDYAKKNNISYQAAKKETKHRKIISLFNCKFIIDNY